MSHPSARRGGSVAITTLVDSARSRQSIFISYRRDDSRSAAGRLYDWLRIAFGREHVFRDVASIGAGKWRDKIDAALARSAVCLPVIGPRWLDATNGARLFEADDLVRHEIRVALGLSDLTVIPALVEAAVVPAAQALPDDLHALLEWNVFTVREEFWEDDVGRLRDAVAGATRLVVRPDFDTLLRQSTEAEARFRELERERHAQAGQIESLLATVRDLVSRVAVADDSRDSQAALAALAQGNTLAAEAEFERVFSVHVSAAERANRNAAEAARNIANLALFRDLKKAVEFYRRATRLDSDSPENWRLLGNAYVTVGDTPGARAAYERAYASAMGAAEEWEAMAAEASLGDMERVGGDLAAALDRYRRMVAVANRRVMVSPDDPHAQRDLAVSHDRVGDVLVAQGDGPGALAAFRKALEIAEALAARDPANTQWQRDLSVSHDKVGDVLVAQGDGPGALAAYRTGLEIAEALAARDPANTEWQRDLSVSHNKVGDGLVAQGDGPAALAAFRKGLGIREALAARDPANTQWQRDLSVDYDRIGDVLVAQGDGPGALAAFRKGLGIREALTARDPANTQWQADVVASCAKLGTLASVQSGRVRRDYLLRGRAILTELKGKGRLLPSQDWIEWFDDQLAQSTAD